MHVSCFLAGIALLIFAGLLVLSIVFLTEGSGRAAFRSLLLALILPAPYFLLSLSTGPVSQATGIILILVTIVTLFMLLIPVKGKVVNLSTGDRACKDERDTMFSRKELKPGTKLFDKYYSGKSEKKVKDDLWRSESGLLSYGSLFYTKLAFAAADASFDTVKLFADLRNNEPENKPTEISGTEVSRFIKAWSKKLGAVDTGFTEMKEYHYYTHAGREDRFFRLLPEHHRR